MAKTHQKYHFQNYIDDAGYNAAAFDLDKDITGTHGFLVDDNKNVFMDEAPRETPQIINAIPQVNNATNSTSTGNTTSSGTSRQDIIEIDDNDNTDDSHDNDISNDIDIDDDDDDDDDDVTVTVKKRDLNQLKEIVN